MGHPPPSAFAQLLRAGLDREGWSQTELADLLELKQQTVSRWLQGRSAQPRWETVARLAELFHWDVGVIVQALAKNEFNGEAAEFPGPHMHGSPTAPELSSGLDLESLAHAGPGFDERLIAGMIGGRRVLVTGAGGWIGSHVARRVQDFEPSELIVLDRDPQRLHAVRQSLRGSARYEVMDVADWNQVDRAFFDHRPDVVLHAAGYRSMLDEITPPAEIVRTNLFGLAHVIHAARVIDASYFAAVSTPKAAVPQDAVGRSRWLGECLLADSKVSSYCSLRFGTLIDSPHVEVGELLSAVRKGRNPVVPHSGGVRVFLKTDHAVDALLFAAATAEHTPVLALPFGLRTSLRRVAIELIQRLNPKLELQFNDEKSSNYQEDVTGPHEEVDDTAQQPLIAVRRNDRSARKKLNIEHLDRGAAQTLRNAAVSAENDKVERLLTDLARVDEQVH